MKVVEYGPEHAQRLSAALRQADTGRLLWSDSFRRHYFLGHRSCRLLLLLADDGDVLATLGLAKLPIRAGNRIHEVSFGTNTYSLKPGAFSFLLMHWMKASELGALMPGAPNLSAMLDRHPRWRSIPGLRTYCLNWDYPPVDGDPAWKKLSKPLAQLLTRIDPARFTARIARHKKGVGLAVEEASAFTEDMIERSGSFSLRLDPSVDYLNWRFCTALDHARYRIFRILKRGTNRGYVVLADWPTCLIVSHCDGDDPEELALGVLLAVSAVNRGVNRYRKVLLMSMHTVMSLLFQRFGFRAKKEDTPFYMAAFGDSGIPFEVAEDWLVHMGWGDSDLVVGP